MIENLPNVDFNRAQYLAIAGSLLLILFIFELTRKKRIRVQYSILWFFFGAVFLFFSVWRGGLEWFAAAVGVSYAPAALFLLLILGIVAILIHFSVIISKLTDTLTATVQRIGLLELVLREKEKTEVPKDHENPHHCSRV